MKHYKAVFIDWDDTIGDFVGAAKQALKEMYEKYELANYFASYEEFFSLYKPHNIALWGLYGEDKVTKEYLSFDRFFYPLMHGSKVGERLKAKGERQKVAVLVEQLSEDFLCLTTAYFSLLDGAEDLVRYLAARYPLTVVTNGFVEVQYEKFEKSGLRDCFKHIVLSEEVGCQKPNSRIFEEALRMNGVTADEAIMIGDSWNSDIQGAINAGIDQIWVKAKPKSLATGDESTRREGDAIVQTATYLVQSLAEVKKIL